MLRSLGEKGRFCLFYATTWRCACNLAKNWYHRPGEDAEPFYVNKRDEGRGGIPRRRPLLTGWHRPGSPCWEGLFVLNRQAGRWVKFSEKPGGEGAFFSVLCNDMAVRLQSGKKSGIIGPVETQSIFMSKNSMRAGITLYKILKKQELNPTVTRMEILAPAVAKKARPGDRKSTRLNSSH